MGKPSKRTGRAARDIHAAIRAAADELRSRPSGGVRNATELPELAQLVDAARGAVAASVPACFEFHGRRYYLQTRLLAQLDIFAEPGAARPLVCGVVFDDEAHGHAPGH